MAKPMHTDMMAWANGDLDVLYEGLKDNQNNTTTFHGLWFGALVFAASFVAWSPNWRWHALAFCLIALERAIWHGREAATRNLLMHQVTIARWDRRSQS